MPTSTDDIVSFHAFANYLKEYIPTFYDHVRYLKPYLKKGASFAPFETDVNARQAFLNLRDSLSKDAALYTPDFWAAANPEVRGRSFELWVDASEFAWGCVLAQ